MTWSGPGTRLRALLGGISSQPYGDGSAGRVPVVVGGVLSGRVDGSYPDWASLGGEWIALADRSLSVEDAIGERTTAKFDVVIDRPPPAWRTGSHVTGGEITAPLALQKGQRVDVFGASELPLVGGHFELPVDPTTTLPGGWDGNDFCSRVGSDFDGYALSMGAAVDAGVAWTRQGLDVRHLAGRTIWISFLLCVPYYETAGTFTFGPVRAVFANGDGNMIRDPGFESPTLAALQRWWSLQTPGEISQDETVVRSGGGVRSLKCTTTRTSQGWNSASPALPGATKRGVNYYVPVTPNGYYEIGGVAKAAAGSLQNHLKISWWQDAGLTISAIKTQDFAMGGMNGPFDWTAYGKTFQAPADANFACVQAMFGYWDGVTGTAGVSWFDNIYWAPLGAAAICDAAGLLAGLGTAPSADDAGGIYVDEATVPHIVRAYGEARWVHYSLPVVVPAGYRWLFVELRAETLPFPSWTEEWQVDAVSVSEFEKSWLFSGVIDEAVQIRPHADGRPRYRVKCVDAYYQIDKRVVAGSYPSSVGQKIGDVVRDLLGRYWTAEGITEDVLAEQIFDSFEDYDYYGDHTMPLGWERNTVGTGAAIWDNTQHHPDGRSYNGGSASMQFSNGTAGNYGGAYRRQGLAVKAGDVLTLSFWYGSSGTGVFGPYRLTCANPGPNISATGYATAQPSAQTGASVQDFTPSSTQIGAWEHFTHDFVVPSGYAWAFVEFYGDTGSNLHATANTDELTLTRSRRNIADGPAVGVIVLPYVQGREALDTLADSIAYMHTLDVDRQLHFRPPGTLPAPFSLTEADVVSDTVDVAERNALYRNQQIVRGGVAFTSQQIETAAGDGASRAFMVSYAIGKVPTVEVKLGAGSYIGRTVGIQGVESGRDFYWNKGENSIAQDSGTVGGTIDTADATHLNDTSEAWITNEHIAAVVTTEDSKTGTVTANTGTQLTVGSWTGGTPAAGKKYTITPKILATTDTVRVSYQGQYPTVVQSGDSAQIVARQAIEGGSGIVEAVLDVNEDVDSETGMSRAAALLEAYSRDGWTLSFATDRGGLRSGQLLPVALPSYGVEADFVITHVTASDLGGSKMRYEIKAVDGPVEGSWESFFEDLAKAAQPAVNLNENTVLTLLQSVTEAWTWGETVTENAWACSFPSATTYPGAAVYPC